MKEDEPVIYDLVEIIQEIDHEVASKSHEVIKAHQAYDPDTRRLLVRLRRTLLRNVGILDDAIEGLGKDYV